jgi:hypothetical protein
MTRFEAALLCGVLISVISASTPFLTCARGDEMPVSGSDDSRMRYIAYDAGQVVHLSTTVGSTLVVGFSPTETVTAVAETDTIHLAVIPPFLTGLGRRIHAARFSFWAGVIPPIPILGRSLLYVQSHCVA